MIAYSVGGVHEDLLPDCTEAIDQIEPELRALDIRVDCLKVRSTSRAARGGLLAPVDGRTGTGRLDGRAAAPRSTMPRRGRTAQLDPQGPPEHDRGGLRRQRSGTRGATQRARARPADQRKAPGRNRGEGLAGHVRRDRDLRRRAGRKGPRGRGGEHRLEAEEGAAELGSRAGRRGGGRNRRGSRRPRRDPRRPLAAHRPAGLRLARIRARPWRAARQRVAPDRERGALPGDGAPARRQGRSGGAVERGRWRAAPA
jgi:hypothetical protein